MPKYRFKNNACASPRRCTACTATTGAVASEATNAIFPESAVGTDFNGDGLLDFYLARRGSADRLLLGVPR